LVLEAQTYPDGVNHQSDPAWAPSPVLRAGEDYRQRTGYRFAPKC
jgi:galactose mutarotase-like enzyme